MRISVTATALLTAALALPAVAQASSAPDQVPAAPRAGTLHPRSDSWEARVLKLTNARRVAHHLEPMKASPCADGFAESWTRHLARREVLEHQSLTPFFTCPRTHTAGENIAAGYDTPRALLSAWMHSPGHRANILNPHFDRIGVSGWVSAHGVTYATQDYLG
jgi:uncharacterized protein YkwD